MAWATNYNISSGNEADLTLFDFAHDFLERDEVKMIAIYMEASTEGRDCASSDVTRSRPASPSSC